MNTSIYFILFILKLTFFNLIFNFISINVVLSICIPRSSVNFSLNRTNKLSFVNTHSPKITKNKIFHLNSGWGLTEKYSWREDDEFVYVSSSLGTDVKSDDIIINIAKDSIKVDKKGNIVPIIEGKTKGKIDVDNSLWTLEEQNGSSHLQITLKKSPQFKHEWFGVLVGESVQLKDYQGSPDLTKIYKAGSVEPNDVYCTKFFRNVDSKKLRQMFVKWMNRESNAMVPFGKPKTDVAFSYLSDSSGDKLIFLDLEYDEYMNVVIKPSDDDSESSELILINGPETNMLKGSYGSELKDKLVKSINVLADSFENDLNKLITLMSSPTTKTTFDYSGSDAILNINNLKDYVEYHKSLEDLIKSKGNVPCEDSELHQELKKIKNIESPNENMEHLIKLTEAIDLTENRKPREQIKNIITNLKNNLELDSLQMGDLFKNAMDRLNRQLNESKRKEAEVAQFKTTDSWFENQMEPKTIIEKNDDPFYAIMNNPANIETSLLVKKYHSISKNQQQKLRERWNNNAKRLKVLINELIDATPDLVSTICNNYRDLLISEDYPTLMKSYLVNNGVNSDREKERLRFLNEFVLSIYKDAEIYTCKDEQYQLSKIKQICDWAINDFENINDLVESNKQQYDVNFMSYLKLIIQKETEMFEKSGISMRPENNPWLSILTIIQIAINSLIQTDISEDLYIITNIVYQKIPKVRTHMIEFILATMPRSDWKAFKKLVFTITDALESQPQEKEDYSNMPEWIPEACYQLRKDVESMIPDWIIDELLSENDKMLMIQNNKTKSPLFQLDFREHIKDIPKEQQHIPTQKIKTH